MSGSVLERTLETGGAGGIDCGGPGSGGRLWGAGGIDGGAGGVGWGAVGGFGGLRMETVGGGSGNCGGWGCRGWGGCAGGAVLGGCRLWGLKGGDSLSEAVRKVGAGAVNCGRNNT